MANYLSSTYEFIRAGHVHIYSKLCSELGISIAGLNLEKCIKRLFKAAGQYELYQSSINRLKTNLDYLVSDLVSGFVSENK
jgi:hypothetical protein